MSKEKEALLHKADKLAEQFKHAQASEIYLSILKEEPDNVSLLLKAAGSIFWSDNWGHFNGKIEANIKKMFELLERAVALEPQNLAVRFNLAWHLAHYGNGDKEYSIKAAREIRMILGIDPTHRKSFYLMGRDFHLIQAGMTIDEAIMLFEKALLSRPNDYEVWECYGEFLNYRIMGDVKDIEELAGKNHLIRRMLVSYQNVKAYMTDEDYERRKKFIDGQINKCHAMLNRLKRAKKRLEKQIEKARENPDTKERPLLDFLEFSILDDQVYGHPEPSYLIYASAKDTGADPDSIIKAIMKLVYLGFSQAYDAHDVQIDVNLKELKKDLLGHADKYLSTHYFNSKFYFNITERGNIELDKKIYNTYGKLWRISSF